MLNFSRVLLLAIGLMVVATAHGRTVADGVVQRRPLLQFVTSSALDAPVVDDAVAVAVRSRRLKASSTPLASVVEDWSLVCKELCGAGLGGVQCAAQCSADGATKQDKATASTVILQSNKDFICRDLCAMQLAGTNCACDDEAMKMTAAVDASAVCHTFCMHEKITLNGCSACAVVNDDGMIASAEAHHTVAAQQLEQQQQQAADAGVSTTTPDWNELCASLCKTGDGGSLCNCDLSPFK